MIESQDEHDILSTMVSSPGWRRFKEKLQYEFDRDYKNLRKCNRDTKFYKTQGFLDGVERAMTMIEAELQEYRVLKK